MKKGLLAICRNFTRYAISRKGHNDWARCASNIFSFTGPLIARSHHVKTPQKRESLKIEPNHKTTVES